MLCLLYTRFVLEVAPLNTHVLDTDTDCASLALALHVTSSLNPTAHSMKISYHFRVKRAWITPCDQVSTADQKSVHMSFLKQIHAVNFLPQAPCLPGAFCKNAIEWERRRAALLLYKAPAHAPPNTHENRQKQMNANHLKPNAYLKQISSLMQISHIFNGM